jgi:IS5 family transposase
LKRVFGAGKALWKGLDGFKADVLAAVITYNLRRLVLLDTN